MDIGTYPVSYLELATPPDSREGVGLDLRLVLYEPAVVHYLNVDNWDDFDWWAQWGSIAFDIRKSQSGRELKILVWSDRHEEVISPPKPRREQDLPAELSVSVEDGLLTVDCVNTPLEELAAEVARATGETVFVDDRVQRLATVQMVGVPIDRFVTAVAAGYGLSVSRFDGAWLVSDGLPTSLAPYLAGEGRAYRLKYLEATDAIQLLPNFLLRYLKPSDAGDSIIAYGPGQLLDRIGEDLAAIDRPSGAIRVRTAVIETSDSEMTRRAWRLLGGDDTRVEIDGGAISIDRGVKPFRRYLAEVRALNTEGRLRVRAQPSLLVRPGASAEIFVGQRQYYQYVAWGEEVALRSVEVGVRLNVRPRPMGSDMIAARVEVSVGTVRGLDSGPPIVDARSAESTLVVGNGDTMVIGGGLVVEEAEREKRGPRSFRDVWLLSDVTGGRSSDEQLREIVFLVSAEYARSRPHEADAEEQT